MKKIYFLIALMFLNVAAAKLVAQSFLGLDGGLEGTATVDNSTNFAGAQVGKWVKNSATTTIALENTTVRSGTNALRVVNTSGTARRIWAPVMPVTTTSAVVIQYYRRVASVTNQEAQEGINRNGTETLRGIYGNGAANTWTKVTYAPVGTTNTANNLWAVLLTRAAATTGDMYIDDMCVYVGTFADVTAPSAPGAATVSGNTSGSLTLDWTAPGTGTDNGGYLVVRYPSAPDVADDPNVNGIYAAGNQIPGTVTGTVVYNGTAINFVDNGLSANTTYYYKVYTYDKAYNYSAEVSTSGATYNDQSTADFISNVTTGDYSAPGSWLYNYTGALYQPATQAPGSNNNVTIANGHTITLTAAGAANVLTLQSSGNIELGNNDLVVNNTTGGSPTGYIRTNGTGRLTVNTITNTGKTLPIGNALYNPLIIENGSGHNWSARVSDGVTADPGFNTNKAVLVTWDILPSVNPPAGPADITFRFDETTQVGPQFTIAETVQAFHRTSGFWLPAGSPATAGGVTTARTVFVSGLISFSPYALANASGPLAINVNYFRGARQGNNHLLNWKVTCSNTPKVTLTVERSNSAAGGFTAIDTREATALRCADPFDFIDAQPLAGINYYRLKMVDIDGKISYSGIVALVNGSKGFDLISIAPNPVVNGNFKLNITSAAAQRLDLQVSDMQGRIVQTQRASVSAGSSSVTVLVDRLATGTYNIYGITTEGRTRLIRFVKR